jgi:hypothetical protein
VSDTAIRVNIEQEGLDPIELEADEDTFEIEEEHWDYTARFSFKGKDRQTVASLALYAQPFGFTQEDVRLLRAIEDEMSSYAWVAFFAPHDEATSHLISIADRIEALLPPATE